MSKIICLDLRPLQIGHQNRGIGMVIKSILLNLEDSKNNYIFYIFDKNNPLESLGIDLKIKNYQIIKTPTIKTEVKKFSDLVSSYKLVFHRFKSLKKYKPDLFIQFDFTLGLPKWKGIKTVEFAYDLIPLILQNEYLPSPFFAVRHSVGKRAKIKAFLRSIFYILKYKIYYKSYQKCNKIISISKTTTRSLIEILNINKNKICTIPLAPVSQKTYSNKILKKITNPYIFYIGGTDSRKRVDHIIYAYNIVRSRGYKLSLVLAGSEFTDKKDIPDNKTRDAVNASPYKKDIRFLGFITDEEKNSLYKNAHSFIFCSLYEGFGLPVIEAGLNKCPVIAYNTSSIPEATGNSAVLVRPNNYTEIANQIIKLFDKKIRNSYIEKGIKNAKKYSWKTYVKHFYYIINNI